MPLILRIVALLGLVLVAACTKPVVYAPEAEVIAARYQDPGPIEISVYNVINNETGRGEHAALLINAPSQRVLFDPAGSWNHPESPERHDVQYGMTPEQLHRYTYYHARRTHHVLILTLAVPPETAEYILRLAESYGPVPDGYCAKSIVAILRQVPGFEFLRDSFQPNSLTDQLATIPGVTVERIYSDAEPTARQTY